MSATAGSATYTVREAAGLLGVHEETVRRMVRGGRLPATRTTQGRGGGAYRIPAHAVEQFIPSEGRAPRPLELRALGKYLLRTGNAAEAWSAYQRALEASRQLNDALGEAKATYKLAQIARRLNVEEDPVELYERALAIYTSLDDRGGRESVFLGLGDRFLERGRWDEADRYYAKAHKEAEARGKGAAMRGRGQAALANANAPIRERIATARPYLDDALKVAIVSGDRIAQANALRSIAKLHALSGERVQAVPLQEMAVRIYEEFGLERRLDEARAELADLEAAVGRKGHANGN